MNVVELNEEKLFCDITNLDYTSNNLHYTVRVFFIWNREIPVVQWFKLWLAVLAIPGPISAYGKFSYNC